MEFEQACTEMNYILENLNPEDLKKIPENFVKFFNENMDKNYKHKLTNTKPLYEQKLKEETKAFIKIVYMNYLATEEKKIETLKLIKDEEKRYKEKIQINIKEDIFENENTETYEFQEKSTEMVVYKENKIIKFIKNILKKVKIIK